MEIVSAVNSAFPSAQAQVPTVESHLVGGMPGAESNVAVRSLRGQGEKTFAQVLNRAHQQISAPDQMNISPRVAPQNRFPIREILGEPLHRELVGLRGIALQGKPLNARDLLVYQIKAGELNLRVEMLGKVADSFHGTLKKLQSQP